MAADQQVKVEIVADPSKGNAGLVSFADRARSASDTVKGAFSGLQVSVREMAVTTSRSLDAANESWSQTKVKMGEAVQAMQPALEGAQEHLEGFKERAESVAKGIAASIAVAMIGGIAATIYTAVKIASASANFIKGLFTGESYKSENINALSEQIKLVDELAGKLRITRAEAGATADAMARLGVSQDDVVSAFQDAGKALRDNGDELERLGVQYKDADGKLLSQRQLLENAAAKLEEYTEGYDRNAAAAAIGVGSLERVRAALSITSDEVAASKKRLDEFNLGIGGETVEAEARYQQAMRDFNNEMTLTSQGIKRAIADQIMPILADLADWFKEGWPVAVNAFRYSMATVTTLFYGLKNVAYIVSETIIGALSAAGTSLAAIAKAYLQFASGDFSGARNTLVSGFEKAKDRIAQIGDNIVKQIKDNNKAIGQAFGMDGRDSGAMGGPGTNVKKGKSYEGKPDDEPAKDPKSRMSEWEAQLGREREAYEKHEDEMGTLREYSVRQERDFWGRILATLSTGDEARSGVERKYYEAKRKIRRDDFEAEQQTLLTEIDAQRGNYDVRQMLLSDYVERAKAKYGEDSKEYQAALKIQQAALRSDLEARRAIAAILRDMDRDDRLEAIDGAERQAYLERSLGVITQQELLAIRRQAIEQRRQIELQAKMAELEAMKGGPSDPVEVARLEAEIAAIKRRYRGALQDNADDQKVEKSRGFEAFFGTSQQAIETGLASAVNNMKVTLGGIRDVARQIGASLVQELAIKPAAAWMVQQARMVAMSWLFGQEKVAAEATTQGEITAVQAAGSLKTIAMRAYEAAAGAYSAIAAIPYVGPVLAPVAAGVALAGVLAFAKNMYSAEGGFDIPKGLNPIVQAHANEMLLPSKHADTMRALSDLHLQGGLSNGGGGSNFHISALDARSFEQMLKGRQGDMIVRAIARRVRNGAA